MNSAGQRAAMVWSGPACCPHAPPFVAAADEDMQGGGRMDGPLPAVGFGEQSLDSCEGVRRACELGSVRHSPTHPLSSEDL